MLKKKIYFSIFATAFMALQSNAQLFISSGTTFTIQSGATVTVQGDVTSSADILGPGKLLLKGTANQNVNMNGFTVPNLEMDNAVGATLTGNARIGTNLNFVTGKIQAANFDISLANTATATGGGVSKFVETSGTGKLIKEVNSNLASFNMPVGVGSSYFPVAINTTGTYSSATVGVQSKSGADPNKHPRSSDYLNQYLPITQTGISGTLSATGNYNASFTGTESDLRGLFWNGTSWSSTGGAIDNALDNASATISGNGDLYAMNRFVLAKMKVFLQSPYNTGTARMNDNLRNSGAYVVGTLPASNLLPTTDPYSSAPYNASTNFGHINNAVTETIASSVLNDQANPDKNVVDWVFVELRDNAAAPTNKLQTRSALLLRDGSIVDVDGFSDLYFKNIDPGSFNLSVKHRNHLGVRTAGTQALSLSSGSVIDFTNNANLLSNFAATLSAGVYGLYAGNANANANIRITGPNASISDFEQLKTTLGALSSLSLTNANMQANGQSDVNFNRIVRVTGPNASISDFEYMKSILGALSTITQPTF